MQSKYEIDYNSLEKNITELKSLIGNTERATKYIAYISNCCEERSEVVNSNGRTIRNISVLLKNLVAAQNEMDRLFKSTADYFETFLGKVVENDTVASKQLTSNLNVQSEGGSGAFGGSKNEGGGGFRDGGSVDSKGSNKSGGGGFRDGGSIASGGLDGGGGSW